MPLINLTTDLKSLRYGSDRPGGGNSGEPFIVTPIPPQDQSNTETTPNVPLAAIPQQVSNAIGINNPFTTNVSIGNTGNGIIRGGITTAASRAFIDAARVNRFLQSTAGGIFVDKQKSLSRIAPLTQGGGTINNDFEFQEITMKGQAAGNAFGLHLLKQTDSSAEPGDITSGFNFMVGTTGEPIPGRYLDAVDPFTNNTLTLNDNRLVALSRLFNTFYLSDDEKLTGTHKIGPGGFISLNEGGNLITYPQGPNSGVEGIATNIRFADGNQRTGENNPFLLGTGFYGAGFGGTLQGGSFNLLRIARQGASFIQGGLDKLGRKKGFLGFLGNALASQVPSLFGKGAQKLDEFIQNSISNALGLENLSPQSNFEVFVRPTPTFNYLNYIRLSNVFGAIESDPLFFNSQNNFIDSNGNRSSTFDFNVYQGNGDISITNFQIQNKNGGATWTQKNILEAPQSPVIGTVGEDFRKTIIDERGANNVKTVISSAPSYRGNKILETRVNAGDPGKVPITKDNSGVYNYAVGAQNMAAINKITAMEPKNTEGSRPSRYTNPTNDFIQFNFAVINNNTSATNKTTYVHFPAFINNFTDDYTGNWGAVKYTGRGDSFYNYEGFDRSISIGFTVAAQSKAELGPMYKKLNYLASTMAPDYQAGGFMRGNLIRMTMGWYLYELPGFFSSFNISLPSEAPFEINVTGYDTRGQFMDDDSVGELPLLLNVDATFVPIHNFLVSKVASSDGSYPSTGAGENDSRFISLTDGSNNLYNKTNNFDGTQDPLDLSRLIDEDRDNISNFIDIDSVNFIGPLLPG